jgi:hypothetical protein
MWRKKQKRVLACEICEKPVELDANAVYGVAVPKELTEEVLTEAWKREAAAEAANPTRNKVARESYVMLAALATDGTTLGDSLDGEDAYVVAGRMFAGLGARPIVKHQTCAEALGPEAR